MSTTTTTKPGRFYVAHRHEGETKLTVWLEPWVKGWAEDIAEMYRRFGNYADVRVIPCEVVDQYLAQAGAR